MAHPSSPPLPANSSPESSLLVVLLPPEEEEEEEDEGVLSPAEFVSVWLEVGRRSAAFCMCVCVKARVKVVLQTSEFQ